MNVTDHHVIQSLLRHSAPTIRRALHEFARQRTNLQTISTVNEKGLTPAEITSRPRAPDTICREMLCAQCPRYIVLVGRRMSEEIPTVRRSSLRRHRPHCQHIDQLSSCSTASEIRGNLTNLQYLKMPSKFIRILRITFCYKQLCGRCLVHMTPVVKVVTHCVFALL